MASADREYEGKGLWGGKLIQFEQLESTNTWTLDNIGRLGHGTVIQANHQTAGRGRFERPWLSSSATSLALSLVIEPCHKSAYSPAFAGMAVALATSMALKKHGLNTSVKWPNDVLASGRKIAGILVESRSDVQSLVIGVGVNISIPEHIFQKAGLLDKATSILVETGSAVNTSRTRDSILCEAEAAFLLLEKDRGASLLDQWKQADSFIGKTVQVRQAQGTLQGVYQGPCSDGRLILEKTDGTKPLLDSGDVTLSTQAST